MPVLGVIAIAPPAALRAPDPATRHHHPDVAQPPTRIVTVEQTRGFDWGDAGIGAAGALGATMLVGGSAVLLARNRRGTVSDPAGDLGQRA